MEFLTLTRQSFFYTADLIVSQTSLICSSVISGKTGNDMQCLIVSSVTGRETPAHSFSNAFCFC